MILTFLNFTNDGHLTVKPFLQAEQSRSTLSNLEEVLFLKNTYGWKKSCLEKRLPAITFTKDGLN